MKKKARGLDSMPPSMKEEALGKIMSKLVQIDSHPAHDPQIVALGKIIFFFVFIHIEL